MVDATIKKVVVYNKQVMERLRQGRRRVLFRQGSYLQRTMQRAMRYSDKPSRPGRPPHAHKNTRRGPLLRKLIRYDVDADEGTVLCGPMLLGVSASRPLPELLDQGGRPEPSQLRKTSFRVGQFGTVREGVRIRLKTAAQADRASRLAEEENALRRRSLNHRIAPRPFVAPVFTDGGENFAKLIEKEGF